MQHQSPRSSGLRRFRAAALSLLFGAGCSGQIAGQGAGAGGNSGSPGSHGGASTPPLDNSPRAAGGSPRPDTLVTFFDPPSDAARPIARLTREQLQNVALDLFGVTLTPDELSAVPEGRAVDTTIDPSQYAQGVWTYAGLVASRALTAPAPLASVCTKQKLADAACARGLVTIAGPLLLQRKLTGAEADAYVAHWTESDGLPAGERFAAVLRAMLLAPGFLFPTEKAPDGPMEDHFRLSRLTLALWSSLPDADTVTKLGAAAGAGKTNDVVAALLADPRAARFYRKLGDRFADTAQLGSLTRASDVAKAFGPDVQAAATAEIARIFATVSDGSAGDGFQALMTSPKVWVNAKSAFLYDVTSGAASDLTAVDSRPEEQRSGLLTAAGLLSVLARSDEGSVVKRGVFVLQRLLCVPPPPPPPNVPPLEASGSTEALTQRQRLQAHRKPACAGCHKSIDGVGQGLERYDGIGRFVTKDHDQPLTGSGTFPQTMDGPERDFSGAQELGNLLAASSQARECFVRQVHATLSGRDSHPDERAALDVVRKRFVGGGNVATLITDLLGNDATSARY